MEGSRTEASATQTIECVATHHLNTFASGVARFNEILAEHLGVPLLGLFDKRLRGLRRPLLSFKVGELAEGEGHLLEELLRSAEWEPQVYLHDWQGLELERQLVRRAGHVFCGNQEVLAAVSDLCERAVSAWTPGLLLDRRVFQPAEISVFSFGMAHKIQTEKFRQLRELLERSGQSYVLYVSSSNHETASIRDAQLVFEEMHEIFPRSLYFVGNLSDIAIYNYLRTTTYFAAFFPKGVRANNTSVAAAMEQGCVVITNLDHYSPAHLVNMENAIDIDRCEELPSDPLVLKRLSVAAMESARARDWSELVRRLLHPGGES